MSNPLIEPYDYWRPYQENIEKLKNRPELIEFDKLCYELFHLNESGKRLAELLNERYVLPSLVSTDNPRYEIACVWAEGFKEAFRLLARSAKTHSDRSKVESENERAKRTEQQ